MRINSHRHEKLFSPVWERVRKSNDLFVEWQGRQSIFLMNFAGLPATTVMGGTSLVTTLLAPTMAP